MVPTKQHGHLEGFSDDLPLFLSDSDLTRDDESDGIWMVLDPSDVYGLPAATGCRGGNIRMSSKQSARRRAAPKPRVPCIINVPSMFHQASSARVVEAHEQGHVSVRYIPAALHLGVMDPSLARVSWNEKRQALYCSPQIVLGRAVLDLQVIISKNIGSASSLCCGPPRLLLQPLISPKLM